MHVLNTGLIHKIDCYLDEKHDEFAELGELFFAKFRSDSGKISTQVRNFQQIACSATRFADVEDFVKNQMGKGDSKWKAVGREVLVQLERLRHDSQTIADDDADRMAVRLRLARGWVRAVVGDYLYRLALEQMGDRV